MTWQPIPTVTAPHYLDTNLNQVQKCVNWYHEKTPDGYVLSSLPGYQLKGAVANNAACRGAVPHPSGQMFSVNGDKVYLLDTGGTSTQLTGSLLTSSGDVFMACSLGKMLITDGLYGYVVDILASTVTQITDLNFPTPNQSCTCFNSQFIVAGSAEFDRWYMSAVDDGMTWTPVISGRSIISGDRIKRAEAVKDSVFFFGESETEQWYAASVDPYLQPITGATIPIGIFAPQNVARLVDSLYVFGRSRGSKNSIWAISGGQASKIATPYIEERVSPWSAAFVRMFAYNNGGQDFVELYEDASAASPGWLFNITTGTWSEVPVSRSLKVVLNGYSGSNNAPYAMDSTNGNIYWLGTATAPYNSNNGNAITRILDFNIEAGMNRIFNSGIRFEFEAQHDSSSSYTLSATLQKSDDGGRTFDTGITLSKAVTNGTSAQQVVLSSPPLGSAVTGRIYRLTMAGPAARLILRRAEGLVRVGRF